MMSREMTNKEAISNLNHIYGIVSPDIQRSLDLAIKALEVEKPQGEWTRISAKAYKCKDCNYVTDIEYPYCPICGTKIG